MTKLLTTEKKKKYRTIQKKSDGSVTDRHLTIMAIASICAIAQIESVSIQRVLFYN